MCKSVRLLIVFILAGSWFGVSPVQSDEGLRIATFHVDATPAEGTPVAYAPVRKIEDPLSARGIVILPGDAPPIVLCSVDWLGIANEGLEAWRKQLADAAGTTPDRINVHAVHQHDGPRCDFTSEALLAQHGLAGRRYDVVFARRVIENVAGAIKAALESPVPVTHLGVGQAKIEKVASNRRILGDDGKVKIIRWSRMTDPAAIAAPEGLIDPWVKLLTFFNNDKPIVALSYYATHPQSYYGQGDVTAEFIGLARAERESDSGVLHVHFNGAGGNITAGKYNDGSPEMRPVLTERVASGLKQAWENTERTPISAGDVDYRTTAVALPVAEYLDDETLAAKLTDPDLDINGKLNAAKQLAWLRRCRGGYLVTLSSLELGDVQVVHMPGELFVEYQLAAQQMRPDQTVCMAAYGEYGCGYIGTEVSYGQGGYETSQRASSVAAPVERVLMAGLRQILDAADDPAIDTDQVADLPARFNGRLTTWAALADNSARMIGGATRFHDMDGNTHDALPWLLMLMSNKPQYASVRVFPLESTTAEALGLDPTASGRYAVEELMQVYDKYIELTREAEGKDKSELSRTEKELSRLAGRVQLLTAIIESHRDPTTMGQEELAQVIPKLQQIEEGRMFRIVPVEDRTGRWRVLFNAAFDDFAATKLGLEEYPDSIEAKRISQILSAFAREDAAAFADAVDEYREGLKSLRITESSFNFEVPEGWFEPGVDAPYQLKFYSDGHEWGTPVAQFYQAEGNATLIVNHFPNLLVDPRRLLNSWRIQVGLPPITQTQFENSIVETDRNGDPAWEVKISPPAEYPLGGTRVESRIVHHASGTWVLSLYDSDELSEARSDYEALLNSIRLKDDMATWLSLDTHLNTFSTDDLMVLGAVRRFGGLSCVVQATGTPELIEQHREAIVQFVTAIELADDLDGVTQIGDLFEFDAPAKIVEYVRETGFISFYIAGDDNAAIDLRVTVMMPLKTRHIEDLANHWRTELQAEALHGEALRNCLRIDESGEPITWIEFASRPE